ncbi:hypothetical protein A5683_03880 [Mycobacterium mantenii]|uniref:Uncharacterized protein n=1 Tax=Mycobacterium mantenii TaxID=560555 RepID=A0A1A2T1H4_MYCNT|nr:hypothetical protein A5688_24335 [Mycobacterium mantenii]OBH70269.1 hypothetical protein A5683_03880 [Mycobacterium mantenii]
MNPDVGSGSMFACRRAQDSSDVSGQPSSNTTTATPQATAGTCTTMVLGQRNARKPPLGTYSRYAR